MSGLKLFTKTSITILATLFLLSGQATAADKKDGETLKLTDTQMDRVTAGAGANNASGPAPWGALRDAGFSLHHNLNSDNGKPFDGVNTGVAVPSAVPNSRCIAFCRLSPSPC